MPSGLGWRAACLKGPLRAQGSEPHADSGSTREKNYRTTKGPAVDLLLAASATGVGFSLGVGSPANSPFHGSP